MTDLSLHVLDIAQNSIVAGANKIQISIEEDKLGDFLLIEISDNGKGMEQEAAEKAMDPYVTSRTTRSVGLGLPLFKQAADQCQGTLRIESAIGIGTRVKATFSLSHIDRQPLGDIAGVISLLTSSNPGIDFIYKHHTNSGDYKFDTKEVKEILEGMPINDPKVILFIKDMIFENLKEINVSA